LEGYYKNKNNGSKTGLSHVSKKKKKLQISK
jgi:hypothetical protein